MSSATENDTGTRDAIVRCKSCGWWLLDVLRTLPLWHGGWEAADVEAGRPEADDRRAGRKHRRWRGRRRSEGGRAAPDGQEHRLHWISEWRDLEDDQCHGSQPSWQCQTDDQKSLSIGALEFDPTDASNQTLVAGIGIFSNINAAQPTPKSGAFLMDLTSGNVSPANMAEAVIPEAAPAPEAVGTRWRAMEVTEGDRIPDFEGPQFYSADKRHILIRSAPGPDANGLYKFFISTHRGATQAKFAITEKNQPLQVPGDFRADGRRCFPRRPVGFSSCIT
jgi:hypothetical protein